MEQEIRKMANPCLGFFRDVIEKNPNNIKNQMK